jgi:signal transduction histidine kinase
MDGIPGWVCVAAGAALVLLSALLLCAYLRASRRESALRGRLEGLEAHARRSGRLAAAGQLAVGLAHDINNHLATAQTSLSMLAPAVEGQPGIKYLSYLRDAVAGASETLRRLISFSKGDDLEDRPVPVGELLASTAELLRRASEGAAAVEFEGCAGGEYIRGNYSELQNAILNIGLNARDALPERGGKIEVRAWTADGNPEKPASAGRWCFVSIRDNGCGMAPGVRERIFDPFFTTKEGRGSGLGLFSVQSSVARHGGTISVRSAAGEGTEFVLAFPGMEGEIPPAATAASPLFKGG